MRVARHRRSILHGHCVRSRLQRWWNKSNCYLLLFLVSRFSNLAQCCKVVVITWNCWTRTRLFARESRISRPSSFAYHSILPDVLCSLDRVSRSQEPKLTLCWNVSFLVIGPMHTKICKKCSPNKIHLDIPNSFGMRTNPTLKMFIE